MQSLSLLAGLGLDPSRFLVTPTTMIQPMAAGTCSADGQFIWSLAPDGTGYWRRLAVGEHCQSISTQAGPETRTGPGGGITVAETPSFRTLQRKYDELMTARTGRVIQNLTALAPTLPPCPTSSQESGLINKSVDVGKPCYSSGVVPVIEDTILPPGTFSIYDVAFNFTEINNGAYEKTFTPTDEQKLLFGWEVVAVSSLELKGISRASSIEKALREHPDFRVKLEGFPYNPIEPTAEEWRNEGGYDKWIRRGGYPISIKVAQGQIRIGKEFSISACASIKCACPTAATRAWGAWMSGGTSERSGTVNYAAPWPLPPAMPRCVGALITKDGLQTGSPDPHYSKWDMYIAIDGVPNGQYILKIAYHDPSWFASMQHAFAEAGRELAKMYCGNPGPIKDELKKTTKENCVNASQQPCTKGTAGCTCSAPSTTTKVSVNAWQMYMDNVWCPGWLAQEAPPEMPSIPETPPNLNVKKTFPWGLALAGGAAAVGIAAFLLRPR